MEVGPGGANPDSRLRPVAEAPSEGQDELEALSRRLDGVKDDNERQTRELRARLLRLEHRLEALERGAAPRGRKAARLAEPSVEAAEDDARPGRRRKKEAIKADLKRRVPKASRRAKGRLDYPDA